jgi:hypothetical protein
MTRISEDYPVIVLRKRGFSDLNAYEAVRDALRLVEEFKRDVVTHLNSKELQENGVTRSARASDPVDPPTNAFCIWQSDGTGTGDDGDLMIKITDSNGVTKSTTLVDYSAV